MMKYVKIQEHRSCGNSFSSSFLRTGGVAASALWLQIYAVVAIVALILGCSSGGEEDVDGEYKDPENSQILLINDSEYRLYFEDRNSFETETILLDKGSLLRMRSKEYIPNKKSKFVRKLKFENGKVKQYYNNAKYFKYEKVKKQP